MVPHKTDQPHSSPPAAHRTNIALPTGRRPPPANARAPADRPRPLVEGLLEQVVTHEPLVALVVAEELRAREEEAPPPRGPQGLVVLAVDLLEDGPDGLHVGVHAPQPHLERLGVVHPVDRPLVDELEGVAEVEEEVVGRHGASREKVLAHPVVVPLRLEVVGEVLVAEDVDESLGARLEPLGHALEEEVIVLHVLKHLDRHDAVVLLAGGHREVVHVGRDHGEVLEAELPGPVVDVSLLVVGVGDAGDGALGEPLGHPQGEGAPAAPQLEHLLALLQLGPLLHLREGGDLRPVEIVVVHPLGEDAGAVL
mmetsp:Transcript_21742/g.54628  ORF Transcript_21742/g.54628 Transcript_21742/m.54628 type:complete len:310 (+) Transcript_21742:116-1045(+)